MDRVNELQRFHDFFSLIHLKGIQYSRIFPSVLENNAVSSSGGEAVMENLSN